MRLVSSDFDASELQIHRVHGVEKISEAFRFDVEFVHEGGTVELDEVVGCEISLVFDRADEEVRRLHGMIADIEDLHDTEDQQTTYRLTMVPRVWRMTLVETLDIFMDMSVPEVIEKKLALVELNAAGIDYEMRLMGQYPQREFIVQYKETDLNFISRLAEHLGISFYFDHSGSRDKIIFVDRASGFTPIADDPTVEYHRRGEEIGVFALHTKRSLIPAAYVCRDYNYRTPTLELHEQKVLDEGDAGGIIEYGGHFKNAVEGATLATVRSEEKVSTKLVSNGKSDDQRFGAGHVFSLNGHPTRDGNFLIVEMEHRHEQTVATGVGTGDERTYRNTFKAIDAAINYRPPRNAHIPRIYGLVTGLVETDGQGSVGKYAQIDNEGRYTIKFLFDTAPPGERKASRPVRRLQPTAGPNYGMHFPLRPGVEVLMSFIDGDPDRPLVVGAVPNPVTPSPVDAPVQTKNRIKTESGVLFEIEDGAGS
jgi:type VI secretion system secreted protein VgrG